MEAILRPQPTMHNNYDALILKYKISLNVHTYIKEAIKKVTNVTGPDKTGLIALFCISRNTIFNIECTVLLWWLDTVTPDILYNKCSYGRGQKKLT